jgi:hypothetical protein
MLNLDPKWRFIIGMIVTAAIGVSSGALVLTNAIPGDLIKPVTAWCGIIAFLGSAAQTALQGTGMLTSNKLAAVAAIPEVKAIITTPEVAAAAPSDKVQAPK